MKLDPVALQQQQQQQGAKQPGTSQPQQQQQQQVKAEPQEGTLQAVKLEAPAGAEGDGIAATVDQPVKQEQQQPQVAVGEGCERILQQQHSMS